MNADFKLIESWGGGACLGTGAGAGGSFMSKRSIEAFLVVFVNLGGADGGLEAKLKSPKSFESSGDGFGSTVCGGLDAIDGFVACFGPVSKNPPPLNGGEVT